MRPKEAGKVSMIMTMTIANVGKILTVHQTLLSAVHAAVFSSLQQPREVHEARENNDIRRVTECVSSRAGISIHVIWSGICHIPHVLFLTVGKRRLCVGYRDLHQLS